MAFHHFLLFTAGFCSDVAPSSQLAVLSSSTVGWSAESQSGGKNRRLRTMAARKLNLKLPGDLTVSVPGLNLLGWTETKTLHYVAAYLPLGAGLFTVLCGGIYAVTPFFQREHNLDDVLRGFLQGLKIGAYIVIVPIILFVLLLLFLNLGGLGLIKKMIPEETKTNDEAATSAQETKDEEATSVQETIDEEAIPIQPRTDSEESEFIEPSEGEAIRQDVPTSSGRSLTAALALVATLLTAL